MIKIRTFSRILNFVKDIVSRNNFFPWKQITYIFYLYVSTGKRMKILIILQWTFAVLFSFPMFRFEVVHKIIGESEKAYCMINYPPWAWKVSPTCRIMSLTIIIRNQFKTSTVQKSYHSCVQIS